MANPTMNGALSKASAKQIYLNLIRCRMFDDKIVEMYAEQEMRCPTHLSLGQEAMASGVCAALRKDDLVYSTHRCHSHSVAKGSNIQSLMAELYGKEAGCCRGKGGSMHFLDTTVGMYGSSAIVGGTVPIAVGAALAAKMQKKDIVVAAFFGDGALEQGTFHEGMNIASLHKLPILFVCENNDLATCTELAVRQPYKELWKRAEGYHVPGVRVDGTRAEEAFAAAEEAVARARKGGGPSFIEGPCYRWKEHVGPKTDFHLGFRTKEELDDQVANHDPVKNFTKLALDSKLLTQAEMDEVSNAVRKEVNDAVAFSKQAPFPAVETIYEDL